MLLIKKDRTNWGYLLILIILATAVGGGVFCFATKQEIPPLQLPMIKRVEKNPIPIYLKLFEGVKEDLISREINFLEVHLDEMKIRFYNKGLLMKEVPIIRKGDPQKWGGSAVGLYNIISGSKVSFSIIANAYMPYALHYYGKYYIHGDPYYSSGQKLASDVSGGCINLSDEDAKTIYELSEINMPVLVIDKNKDYYEYPVKKISKFPAVSAQGYLVADLDSGYVFAEKDSQKIFPIASLTKLITVVVVAENIDLRKSILVEKKMLEAYGSTKGLEAGKWFRVIDLFYPSLIESSNDAAEVLSYFLGREKTIKLMNEKARAILMEKTTLVDPSGLDPENVSTAQDLFYLARYLLNNRPLILEITKGKEVLSFGKVSFEIKDLWNKNIFINDPTFIGGKVGFTKISKDTAIFIFNLTSKDGVKRNIAITLLDSENNEIDTQKIYRWLQENYFNKGEGGCIDNCGNGMCEEAVCTAIGCPCAETELSCPEDCKKSTEEGTTDWQTYRNEEYGFTLTLSQGWQGYAVTTGPIEYGWKIVIRNPQWTEVNPYEDIPILVYPIEQWKKWEANNFEDYPTAAPFGPLERGRNAQYVFATAPRYNYDYRTGWEDVENIIKTLKAF